MHLILFTYICTEHQRGFDKKLKCVGLNYWKLFLVQRLSSKSSITKEPAEMLSELPHDERLHQWGGCFGTALKVPKISSFPDL